MSHLTNSSSVGASTDPHGRNYRLRITPILMVVLSISSGCSKEEMNQALEKAKSKTQSMTQSAVQAVEEQLPETGMINLNMTPSAVAISAVDLELISIGDGRPNVVQIVTYDPSASTRSYPALLLHGTTEISSASALAGERVLCDLYYQATNSSPIAMTKPGEAIVVEFQQYKPEDNALTATVGAVALLGSDDRTVQIEGGDFLAVIRGEEK